MSEATGLRAAIVQHHRTREVLMLGWMDNEAEALTRKTGEVHFYSRSRRRLWHKGESSGNTMRVVAVMPDCDGDALLISVDPAGPSCHTDSASCFAPWLWRRICERASADPDDSYTAQLLAAGTAQVARKVGEEAVETVTAALTEPDERVLSEAADLHYHLLVLLRSRGLDIAQLERELRARDQSLTA